MINDNSHNDDNDDNHESDDDDDDNHDVYNVQWCLNTNGTSPRQCRRWAWTAFISPDSPELWKISPTDGLYFQIISENSSKLKAL